MKGLGRGLSAAAAAVDAAEAALEDLVAARDDKIRAAKGAGQTLAEIAEATGLSIQRLSQITQAELPLTPDWA